MTNRQKKMLSRILIGAICYVTVIIIINRAWLPQKYRLSGEIILFSIPYLIIGGDVLLKAFRNIIRGSVFDENFLMSIATIGAFAIKDYKEAVAVMLFYQVGELFQSYAVNQSRKSIASLMDIRPDYANIEVDGKLQQVNPEEVAIGDIIVVKAGERIPLDGIVLSGNSFVDTKALTGEAVPKEVIKDSAVISGCINMSGLLYIRAEKEFGQSTVSKILDLVENASNKKAKSENFITRFARIYTPMVVITALLLAIIPPLFFGKEFSDWLSRALIFLVISCPCALVISVPLSFFGGIGAASKNGILVKGSNYLEALAKVDTLIFDKTGTLTKGSFEVTDCIVFEGSKEYLLETAALAEGYSDHPISNSLKRAVNLPLDFTKTKEVREIVGQGICAKVDGDSVLCGNERLMQTYQIPFDRVDCIGTIVYVVRKNQYLGAIVIADEIKDDSPIAIKKLKQAGVMHTVMLTGDMKTVAVEVGTLLGIDTVFAELLPQDKVEKVEELLSKQKEGRKLAFVGDGINDAPVLSRADVGIAMGGLGADAAIEAADVVLMDDSCTKISTAISISRKTLRIVKQNIAFALGIKAFILILGAFGVATMWDAVFADVGVSVLAILNAMRTLRTSR